MSSRSFSAGSCFLQPLDRALALKTVVRDIPGLPLESLEAAVDKRTDCLLDNQADQIVGRVVASRILAGEDVGPDRQLFVLANQLPFQQPFVDGTELLNAEVAVVDVSPAFGRPLERKRVDRRSHHGIDKPYVGQQRRAPAVEQPAVIGRQADGRVAPVDGAAQIVDGRPVGRRRLRKRVVLVHAAANVFAHLLAKRIVVVAFVADGQQVAVFGIEDEQKPVEQDQRGLAHFRQRCIRRGVRDGTGKIGEDLSEDDPRQIPGHPLLIEPSFLYRALVECPSVGGIGHEGVPAEHERERLQPMAARRRVESEQPVVEAGNVQHRRQVDLEELLGNGQRALVIKPPLRPLVRIPQRSRPVVRSSTRRR